MASRRLPEGGAPWQAGWLHGARHCPSPNQGPRPAGAVLDLVVLHSISLPPGVFGGAQIEDFFLNRLDHDAHPYFEILRGIEVSAHFLIRRDGELVQFVPVTERAWHAGRSRFGARENCNDFSVGVELEGLEGGAFEPAQYRSLVLLLRALRSAMPVRAVVGHEHVAPGRKADPGPGFDWRGLRRMLRWSAQRFPFIG